MSQTKGAGVGGFYDGNGKFIETPAGPAAIADALRANTSLVVGRPITSAPNPPAAAAEIISEVKGALPPAPNHIDKVALVCVKGRKQLVARSKGKDQAFTPGGKRGMGESDAMCLLRECREELSVELRVETIKPYGVFQAQAHGKPEGTMVIMTCYTAEFDGTPTPANEIEELRWIGSGEGASVSATSALILEDLKKKGLVD